MYAIGDSGAVAASAGGFHSSRPQIGCSIPLLKRGRGTIPRTAFPNRWHAAPVSFVPNGAPAALPSIRSRIDARSLGFSTPNYQHPQPQRTKLPSIALRGRAKSDSADGLGADGNRRPISEIHRWTNRRRAISSTATPKPRSFAAAKRRCESARKPHGELFRALCGRDSPFPIVLATYSLIGANPREVPAAVARPHPAGHAFRRMEVLGVAVRMRSARVCCAHFLDDCKRPGDDDLVLRVARPAAVLANLRVIPKA
jgi:hypothetical protein